MLATTRGSSGYCGASPSLVACSLSLVEHRHEPICEFVHEGGIGEAVEPTKQSDEAPDGVTLGPVLKRPCRIA